MNNKTALITGASKGLGREFAKLHAANGDNLVLIARSRDLLVLLKEELEALHNDISIYLIDIDLTNPNSPLEIYKKVTKEHVKIDYLINNAGVGEFGLFINSIWQRHEQMIDLNMKAVTHLCHLFLPDMVARQQGKILNVASAAAFQPGPMMAVYFATKSYVLHLSEALNNEAKEHGVSVTAFCPGPTDTHFMIDSKMNLSKLVKNKQLATSQKVALSGFNAMMSNKPVKIHGFVNKLIAFSVRLIPRKWVVIISRKIQG